MNEKEKHQHTMLQVAKSDGGNAKGGTPAQLTGDMSDMLVRNPAPDSAASREPTGTYRIIGAN